MAQETIGSACIGRAGQSGTQVVIETGNLAALTGFIIEADIYPVFTYTALEFASAHPDSPPFGAGTEACTSTDDCANADIDAAQGGCRHFTNADGDFVYFDCVPGDAIVCWDRDAAGQVEMDFSGGSGVYRDSDGSIPFTSEDFGLSFQDVVSLNALNDEEEPGAAGAIMNQLQQSNLGADLYNGTLL